MYLTGSCITKEMTPEVKKRWFTQITCTQLDGVWKWRWTSVFVKTIYVGIFFVVIQVGVGKMTYLFLSWLNETLESMDFPVVLGIFYLVGLFMFLLPPVPGVPVYLAGGVILVNVAWTRKIGEDPVTGEDIMKGDGGMSYFAALAFTSMVCFCIKLNAIVFQQRGFGEQMSDNLTVKNFVGVNSVTIRAIGFILSKPGMNRAKVSILVGGPDWPTSVLTGILKLSCVEMLKGSLPVIFLIIPCVCTGGFMLKVNPDDPGDIWPSIFGCTLVIAAMVQSFALGAAGYYTEQAAHEHREELLAMPNDKDVERVEAKNAAKREQYMCKTAWPLLPFGIKVVLLIGTASMVMSCYIINLYASKCFAAFQVTDSIKDDLGGSAVNVILKPWGFIAIYLFLLSCVCLWVFGRWVACQKSPKVAAVAAGCEDEETEVAIDTTEAAVANVADLSLCT